MSALLHFLMPGAEFVESRYSLKFYAALSNTQRMITGKISFSIGDVLYGFFFIFLLISFIRFLSDIFKRRITPQLVWEGLKKIIVFSLVIYLVFNIFWGINYNRVGIAGQTGIRLERYDTAALRSLNVLLAEKVNLTKKAVIIRQQNYPDNQSLFARTRMAYGMASATYPFLNYTHASVKSSVWDWLGNYWGFTGYYNPFTGEAQLNTTVPKFLLPFAACHEVAHQLGYAKEREANFVAYLVARHYDDSLFLYSAYLDMFFYANRNLFLQDSISANRCRELLSKDVMKDVEELVAFNRSHRNFMGPVITRVYDLFLRSNHQPKGMMSYDEVTGYLMAYYRRYGTI